MHELFLEKRLAKPITPTLRKRISKRILELQKKHSRNWNIRKLEWNPSGELLRVEMKHLTWRFLFSDNKLHVSVEYPFSLGPLISPHRAECLELLEKEMERWELIR